MKVDYLVVGAGLTGATIARILADAGREVLVVERRAHIGGMVHDYVHQSGIRVHSHGPHYFRTSDDRVWDFVSRFATFYKYEAIVKSLVDTDYENWPVAAGYIRKVVGPDWKPKVSGKMPHNFEEAALAIMPRLIYERFVKGYTEKQWGVPARSLLPHLADRFDIREDDDPRLVKHRHQGLPRAGYAGLMENMLQGVSVLLNCDYLSHRGDLMAKRKLIFTGSVDEFFGFDLGRLRYRGLVREQSYFPHISFLQPCGQVNNPNHSNGEHIRSLEWKYMMPPESRMSVAGTIITRETPMTATESDQNEYPFPDVHNNRLNGLYQARVSTIPNLVMCGRLGEYKYYDMDQAISRAFVFGQGLVENV